MSYERGAAAGASVPVPPCLPGGGRKRGMYAMNTDMRDMPTENQPGCDFSDAVAGVSESQF